MVLKILTPFLIALPTTSFAADSSTSKKAAPKAVAPAAAPKATVAPNTAATPKIDPVCGTREKKDTIEISPRTYFRLIEHNTATAVSLNTHLCYPVGFRPKLFTSRSEDAVITESVFRGNAAVKSINTAEFEKIKSDRSLGLTADDIKELEVRISKRQKRRPELGTQVYLVTFEKPEWAQEKKNYGVPNSHPMAENVKAKRLREILAANKKNVLDIRAANLFKNHPLKGAVNTPLNIYGEMTAQILTYAEMKQAGLYFPKNVLPKNQDENIYVISASAAEYSSYNFITYLKHLGYKNIYWFRGGVLGLKPKSPAAVTPKTIAGVSNIEAGSVADRVASRSAKLIDVRTHRKKETYSIFTADQTEFVQGYNIMAVPDFRNNITFEKLKAKKEKFSGEIEATKDQHVIIFGQNEYDWAAYKAAVTLVGLGYKNVHWYRQGMDDWKSRSIIDGRRFPLTKSVKKEDLYL